jgi:uncharacterized protein YcbX
MSEDVCRVWQLWRFPVTSMQGERLDEVEIAAGGVRGDRAYALVDGDDGKIVSAKNPRKWARVLELSARFVGAPTDDAVPPVEVTFPDGTLVRSDAAGTDEALSRFLGRPVHLSAVAPPERTMEETWPDVDGLAPQSFIESTRIDTGHDDETVSDITVGMAAPPGTFFDLSVLHLLTTSTLDRLRELRPEGDFDVRRYRPNVLVDTTEAGFVENEWVGRVVGLGTGGAGMRIDLPTMRCIMTTMAQPGLERDPALLVTLARSNRLSIGGGEWACAGSYGSVASPGTVRVGDPVTVT